MVVLDNFNGTITEAVTASLQGIAPMWGTFTLEYMGETTWPIYADATAGQNGIS